MAVGSKRRTSFGAEERSRIEAAVQAAEKATGLQFLVYLGKSDKDTRANAQAFLVKQNYHQLPGVLLFVAPKHRKLEVVTSPSARARITDEQAEQAVAIMVPAFRQGDWVSGVELGLAALAENAGPLPAGESPTEDLPNIL